VLRLTGSCARRLSLTCVAFLAGALTLAPSSQACEPARASLDTPAVLVLSGGGSKAAWEAGAAVALIEGGLPVRLVAGSSAGALNAAMLVDGRLERLSALWRSVRREQVYALRPGIIFAGLLPGWLTLLALDAAGSLFDPAPLRELIAGSIDLERIRASPRRLLVVTSDLGNRTVRMFDNATVSVDALMAAAAVPGAFPPVAVDGTLLVDGGLTGRAPVLEALATEPTVARAIVLLSYAAEERGEAPTRLRRTLEQAFEMAMVHQIRRDVELARYKYPDVDVQVLAPSTALQLRPLDFDAAAIAGALERGRADAERCLDVWRKERR
jgi:NTE family protein